MVHITILAGIFPLVVVLNSLESGPDRETIDPNSWRPEYDNYQSWQAINETSMYTAGGLLLTSVVMSFFTDWAGYNDEDE